MALALMDRRHINVCFMYQAHHKCTFGAALDGAP